MYKRFSFCASYLLFSICDMKLWNFGSAIMRGFVKAIIFLIFGTSCYGEIILTCVETSSIGSFLIGLLIEGLMSLGLITCDPKFYYERAEYKNIGFIFRILIGLMIYVYWGWEIGLNLFLIRNLGWEKYNPSFQLQLQLQPCLIDSFYASILFRNRKVWGKYL